MGFFKNLTTNPFLIMRTYSAVASFYELYRKKQKGEATAQDLIMQGAVEPILELAPDFGMPIVDDILDEAGPIVDSVDASLERLKKKKIEPNTGLLARLMLRQETQQYEAGVDL